MDGRFQGMMTHMDQRIDTMQTHFDGQYSAITSRLCTIDDQFDGLNSEFVDLRTHIRDTVHDPIMSKMNNMQQSFQDNMGALSSQFENLSTSDSIQALHQRQQQLQNDFSQFTPIFDSFGSPGGQ
jgi:DNA anti-recombination protein RmuC